MAATEFVGDNLYAGASFEFPCTTVTTPSRPLSSVWTLARSVSSAGVVGGAVSANDGACAPTTAAAVRTAAKTMKRDQRDINALSRGSVAQRSRVRASSQQNGDPALGMPLVLEALAGSLSGQMPADRLDRRFRPGVAEQKGELGAIANFELPVDVAQMELDGFDADEEVRRNDPIRQAAGDADGDGVLGVGQRGTHHRQVVAGRSGSGGGVGLLSSLPARAVEDALGA